jgi:hypothetical protein
MRKQKQLLFQEKQCRFNTKEENQMTKKTSRKSNLQSQAAASEVSGGQVFNIEGGVHAGRDVVMGDQYNYDVENIQNAAEFARVLEAVQAQLAALKQQPELNSAQVRNLKEAEEKVAEAVEETQQPKPLAERIQSTLTEAKETMDLLGGSLQSAAALGTTISGLILMAAKIFGM